MIADDEARRRIEALKHGEHFVWPMPEDAGWEVWRIHDALVLFEIPSYGGEPRYGNTYSLRGIDGIIKEVKSWT